MVPKVPDSYLDLASWGPENCLCQPSSNGYLFRIRELKGSKRRGMALSY